MDIIKLRSCFSQDVTVIANDFLDRFLPEANGDFLRIYLYLVRIAGSGSDSLSLCSVADRMNCTENDVNRALRYWESEGLLVFSDGQLIADGTPREIFTHESLMSSAGLDVPEAAKLCARLRKEGYPLPADLYRPEELREHLLRLWKEGSGC